MINQPPTVSAGADQDTQTDITLSLGGTVSDDGLPVPPGTVTTLWRQISGPGLNIDVAPINEYNDWI